MGKDTAVEIREQNANMIHPIAYCSSYRSSTGCGSSIGKSSGRDN